MPLYTLKVCVSKVEQGENGAPDKPQHSISLSTSNLTLDESKTMQKELAPVLLGWLDKDDE